MSRKEETLLAIQNIGASIFIGGVTLCYMAYNTITLVLAAVLVVVGVVMIGICDHIIEKEKKIKVLS